MKTCVTVGILAVLLLSACGDKHDATYYKDHAEERKAKLLECAKTQEQSVECQEAAKAQTAAFGAGGSPVYVK